MGIAFKLRPARVAPSLNLDVDVNPICRYAPTLETALEPVGIRRMATAYANLDVYRAEATSAGSVSAIICGTLFATQERRFALSFRESKLLLMVIIRQNLPEEHTLFSLYPAHKENLNKLIAQCDDSEGPNDPEHVIDLWQVLVEAYRDFREGEDERAMRGGPDKLLKFAFTNRVDEFYVRWVLASCLHPVVL